MHGYCGRAAIGDAEARAVVAGGARIYAVRPMALIERRRHQVVRIRPQPATVDGNVLQANGAGEGQRETQARAA
jgi:hypothetical protein